MPVWADVGNWGTPPGARAGAKPPGAGRMDPAFVTLKIGEQYF